MARRTGVGDGVTRPFGVDHVDQGPIARADAGADFRLQWRCVNPRTIAAQSTLY
jgi:hypothetical protein